MIQWFRNAEVHVHVGYDKPVPKEYIGSPVFCTRFPKVPLGISDDKLAIFIHDGQFTKEALIELHLHFSPTIIREGFKKN